MKKVIEEYKRGLETSKRYSKKGGIPEVWDMWNRSIIRIVNIISLLETDSMTPELFDKLESRDKWSISKGLRGDVHWYCGGCGEEMDTEPEGTFVEVCCSDCDHTLTRRTGGGMSDPFGWKFKWKLKQLRKNKLLSLYGSQ